MDCLCSERGQQRAFDAIWQVGRAEAGTHRKGRTVDPGAARTATTSALTALAEGRRVVRNLSGARIRAEVSG